MISIHNIGKNKVILHITMGDQLTKIVNMPTDMAKRYAVRKVAEFIKKFVNHRRQIIMFHGGMCTQEKIMALDRLTYKVNGADRWNYDHLPRIIKGMEKDLLTILPGHSSKYFKSSCEKVADILAIKNQDKLKELV